MTVKQAAVLLDCSERLVYKLCTLGKLGHRRIGFGSGKVQIDEAHLEAYKRSCEVEPFEAEPAPRNVVRRIKGLVIPDVLGQMAREREARAAAKTKRKS